MPEPGAGTPSMRERMLAGQPAQPRDAELSAMGRRAIELQEEYNRTPHAEAARRRQLLEDLLGSVGDGVTVRPNFRCDYGSHIHIAARTFVNFDCVFLDGAEIRIGESCWIAPQVQLITPNHAIDPLPRRQGWEICGPITLEDNVWLGARVVVLPDVTIGTDSIIGAGSVVTKDVPAGVIAVGSPARVLREINASDRLALPGT